MDKWKVLVVEDDRSLQDITKMTLKVTEFNHKKIDVLQAYSAADAIAILNQHKNIAVIFLDIKMETPDAGLHVIQHVRNKQKNNAVRIVIRTGQQEIFPEKDALTEYDIDDYRDKKVVDANALITLAQANLKTYDRLFRFELLDQLCEDLVTSHIPELIMSAKGEKLGRLERLRRLVDNHISKPFDADKLKARIQSVLSLQKLRQGKLMHHILIEHTDSSAAKPIVELTPRDKVFIGKWEKVVDQFYADDSVNVEKLAHYMNISSSHLLARLKNLIGKGPKDFLMEYRILQAKYLLTTEPLSIADIATAVGFSSQSHFCTAFKNITSITPSEYRRTHSTCD